jgi:phosphatidate cytidylyltransferase
VRERAISAVVIAAVVIIVFLLGQPWLTLGVVVLAALASLEVFRLLPLAGFPAEVLPGGILAPLAVLAMGVLEPSAGWVAIYMAAVLIVLAIDAFRRPEVRGGFLAWIGGSFGALYVAPRVHHGHRRVGAGGPDAVLSGVLDAGRTWLLVLVLTVWSFDTFAYLTGRTFKRGRFLNHISPNKTWSGVIGGTVAATLVAGGLAWAAGQWLPGGLLLGLLVAGQAGDVAESMLKRTAGAKDSEHHPGHGGILGRGARSSRAPVVFGYLLVIGP